MQENPLRNYGEMLKGFREDNCLTQQQVANELGVTKMTVSNWERGINIPRPEKREALKYLYNMPPEADVFNSLRMYSKEELIQIVMNLLERKG
jgi:transcriptional regulator with XRE-family HTH domain